MATVSVEVSGPRGSITAVGPAALQRRLLLAVMDVAAETNGTLVMVSG
jgi:hypothetical protein